LSDGVDGLLVWLGDVPPLLMYVVLGLGAAVENIVPPIPADTFVLLGGFLAARGSAVVGVIFLVTWTANVLSALVVYTVAYRYGDQFFQTRLGRYLLDPKQVGIVRKFYRRWGTAAIFYTRFLPGLRAVAPVFAGLIRQRPLTVVLPLLLASAIWYGALVWIGAFAGRNVEHLLRTQTRLNWTLAAIAGVIFVLLAWWWFRSRGSRSVDTGPGSGQGQQGDEPETPSE
jgi:membrane protein DedA with SNARE-associated domain